MDQRPDNQLAPDDQQIDPDIEIIEQRIQPRPQQLPHRMAQMVPIPGPPPIIAEHIEVAKMQNVQDKLLLQQGILPYSYHRDLLQQMQRDQLQMLWNVNGQQMPHNFPGPLIHGPQIPGHPNRALVSPQQVHQNMAAQRGLHIHIPHGAAPQMPPNVQPIQRNTPQTTPRRLPQNPVDPIEREVMARMMDPAAMNLWNGVLNTGQVAHGPTPQQIQQIRNQQAHWMAQHQHQQMRTTTNVAGPLLIKQEAPNILMPVQQMHPNVHPLRNQVIRHMQRHPAGTDQNGQPIIQQVPNHRNTLSSAPPGLERVPSQAAKTQDASHARPAEQIPPNFTGSPNQLPNHDRPILAGRLAPQRPPAEHRKRMNPAAPIHQSIPAQQSPQNTARPAPQLAPSINGIQQNPAAPNIALDLTCQRTPNIQSSPGSAPPLDKVPDAVSSILDPTTMLSALSDPTGVLFRQLQQKFLSAGQRHQAIAPRPATALSSQHGPQLNQRIPQDQAVQMRRRPASQMDSRNHNGLIAHQRLGITNQAPPPQLDPRIPDDAVASRTSQQHPRHMKQRIPGNERILADHQAPLLQVDPMIPGNQQDPRQLEQRIPANQSSVPPPQHLLIQRNQRIHGEQLIDFSVVPSDARAERIPANPPVPPATQAFDSAPTSAFQKVTPRNPATQSQAHLQAVNSPQHPVHQANPRFVPLAPRVPISREDGDPQYRTLLERCTPEFQASFEEFRRQNPGLNGVSETDLIKIYQHHRYRREQERLEALRAERMQENPPVQEDAPQKQQRKRKHPEEVSPQNPKAPKVPKAPESQETQKNPRRRASRNAQVVPVGVPFVSEYHPDPDNLQHVIMLPNFQAMVSPLAHLNQEALQMIQQDPAADANHNTHKQILSPIPEAPIPREPVQQRIQNSSPNDHQNPFHTDPILSPSPEGSIPILETPVLQSPIPQDSSSPFLRPIIEPSIPPTSPNSDDQTLSSHSSPSQQLMLQDAPETAPETQRSQVSRDPSLDEPQYPSTPVLFASSSSQSSTTLNAQSAQEQVSATHHRSWNMDQDGEDDVPIDEAEDQDTEPQEQQMARIPSEDQSRIKPTTASSTASVDKPVVLSEDPRELELMKRFMSGQLDEILALNPEDQLTAIKQRPIPVEEQEKETPRGSASNHLENAVEFIQAEEDQELSDETENLNDSDTLEDSTENPEDQEGQREEEEAEKTYEVITLSDDEDVNPSCSSMEGVNDIPVLPPKNQGAPVEPQPGTSSSSQEPSTSEQQPAPKPNVIIAELMTTLKSSEEPSTSTERLVQWKEGGKFVPAIKYHDKWKEASEYVKRDEIRALKAYIGLNQCLFEPDYYNFPQSVDLPPSVESLKNNYEMMHKSTQPMSVFEEMREQLLVEQKKQIGMKIIRLKRKYRQIMPKEPREPQKRGPKPRKGKKKKVDEWARATDKEYRTVEKEVLGRDGSSRRERQNVYYGDSDSD